MNIMSKLLVSSVVLLSSTAHAFTVDGDLNDWIGTPNGNANDWKPTDPTVKYTQEDQNSSFLSPGFGGQAYDAEAMYLKREGGFFYVAIVTGLSPNTTSYPAGDIAFDFGNDGIFEFGVVVKSDSQFSSLNNDQNGGIGNKGQVYDVSQWNVGLWNNAGQDVGIGNGTQVHPTTVKGGTPIGTADVYYGDATYNNNPIAQLGEFGGGSNRAQKHYVIEAKINENLFASADLAKAFTVHWTMACANDSISVDPTVASVPTPDTLTILGLGLIGMLIGSRRNRFQKINTIRF
jgi:hypothetical protein